MMMIVIQPKWAMDEKAKIFRIWVWFSPIHPPKAADAIAMVVINVGLRECEVMNKMVIGGNFIIVDSSRAVVRGEP